MPPAGGAHDHRAMPDAVGTPTQSTRPASDPPAATPPPRDETTKRTFKFPTAFTVLAAVLLLVWIAAFFVPSGRYTGDANGAPVPGTYHKLASCSSVPEPALPGVNCAP